MLGVTYDTMLAAEDIRRVTDALLPEVIVGSNQPAEVHLLEG